jgi:glucokinase
MTTESYAGFDLGGTNLKYGLVNDKGEVSAKGLVPTPGTLAEIMALIGQTLQALRKDAKGPVRAVGLGIPGLYSLKEKRIIQSPNLPQFDGYDLQAGLAKVVDLPFWADNDANLAAYGEWKSGTGRGARSLILLTIGTGVGSGLVLEGELFHGTCGFAGEMGHITVNPEGEKCGCGNIGCLETEAAAPKIVRNYMDLSRTKKPLAAEEIYQRALKGNTAAKQAFAIAGHYLGIGLGIAINMLNPEKILLGGGVMTTGDFIFPAAVEEAQRRSYRASFACCAIERAGLGNDAGFMGAAHWARERFLKERSKP